MYLNLKRHIADRQQIGRVVSGSLNMYAAVAALQMTARRLQLSGGLDQSKYDQIISQLRQITDELTDSDRRAGKQKLDPVNFFDMVRDTVATASAEGHPDINRVAMQLVQDVMVEGPAHDLRDLLRSLFEYALGVGQDPITLRVEVKCTGEPAREMCLTELAIHSPNVPDFLQRKLWNTVRARRGEVSVISEPERCRIGFTLPVERRRAAEV